MSDYIDAILHISDLPALAAAMEKLSPGSVVVGKFNLNTTPATTNGASALVYVRMTQDEADQWRGTPGVAILAEAEYVGPETADAVYDKLEADTKAMANYAKVYPRTPIKFVDDDGKTQTYVPPFRFGQMG